MDADALFMAVAEAGAECALPAGDVQVALSAHGCLQGHAHSADLQNKARIVLKVLGAFVQGKMTQEVKDATVQVFMRAYAPPAVLHALAGGPALPPPAELGPQLPPAPEPMGPSQALTAAADAQIDVPAGAVHAAPGARRAARAGLGGLVRLLAEAAFSAASDRYKALHSEFSKQDDADMQIDVPVRLEEALTLSRLELFGGYGPSGTVVVPAGTKGRVIDFCQLPRGVKLANTVLLWFPSYPTEVFETSKQTTKLPPPLSGRIVTPLHSLRVLKGATAAQVPAAPDMVLDAARSYGKLMALHQECSKGKRKAKADSKPAVGVEAGGGGESARAASTGQPLEAVGGAGANARAVYSAASDSEEVENQVVEDDEGTGEPSRKRPRLGY
jgi:hypothetical protein